ncbi:unnamed protein product, partial [Mesorhabditis spiculigera]
MTGNRLRNLILFVYGMEEVVHAPLDSLRILQAAIDVANSDAGSLVQFSIPDGIVTGTSGCPQGSSAGLGAKEVCDQYYQHNIKAVFGPICFEDMRLIEPVIDEWGISQFSFWTDFSLTRHIPEIIEMSRRGFLNIAYNLRAICTALGWDDVALFICMDCYEDSINYRIDSIRDTLEELNVRTLYLGEMNKTISRTELAQMMVLMKKTARVFITFLGVDPELNILFAQAMADAKLSSDEYIAVYMLHYQNYDTATVPWGTSAATRKLFMNSVLVYNDFPTSYTTAIGQLELSKANEEQQLYYLQLYEAVQIYAYALNALPEVTGDASYDGEAVAGVLRSNQIQGPFGSVFFNNNTMRLSGFVPFYVTNDSVSQLANIVVGPDPSCNDTIYEDTAMACYTLLANTSILADVGAKFPQDVPPCGFTGELCDQTSTVIIIAAVMTAIIICIVTILAIRKMRSGETASMPWAIPVQMVKLVDVESSQIGSQQLSIHSIQQQLEDKSAEKKAKESLKSRQLATIDQAYVVVESYSLKEKLVFSRHEMHWLYLIKQISHDNLNPFMGLCFDRSQHLFVMWSHCFRWKNNSVISTLDGAPIIANSELHYYAPEIRKGLKTLMYTNRMDAIQLSPKQGQAGDLYGFGMILFEILYRKKVASIDDAIVSEEDNLILCEQAEAQVPLYPTIPESDDVHPDLLGLMHKCWGAAETRPDTNLARKITDATLKMSGSLVDQMIKNLEQYTNNLENLVKERTGQLEEEQKKAEALLSELLPKTVADELKVGRRVDPKTYKAATILYSDIVGFTSLCSESQPMEVVNLLSGMFQRFDQIISVHNCYKIETIGDAYMVASGVPIPSKTDHVRDIASVALQQREFLYDFEIPHRPGQFLHCRWGFNTGPVFTGVVGISAPRYCVFGGTGVGTLLTYWLDGVEELLQSSRDSYKAISAMVEAQV